MTTVTPVTQCEHTNYDEYFETCEDCGQPGEVIHAKECGSTDTTEIENNIFECNKCGFTYFEQMYTTCEHCDEMVIPIDDESFTGICPACGVGSYEATA